MAWSAKLMVSNVDFEYPKSFLDWKIYYFMSSNFRSLLSFSWASDGLDWPIHIGHARPRPWIILIKIIKSLSFYNSLFLGFGSCSPG